MVMNISRLLFALIFCAGCLVLSSRGQNTESIRIPTSGDNCNVVNLNFGRGEENVEQSRGPQGAPGKRGSPGLIGLKGEKGSKGEVGPRGMTPEIRAADITSAIMEALSATTCEELIEIRGINRAGYYLMRSNKTIHPIYNYCDFEIRPGVTTCQQIRHQLQDEMKSGYFTTKESDNEQPRFIYCSRNANDCKAVNRLGAKVLNATGGVFDINPESEDESVEVFCDLETDGGGWTVFQRRMDGTVDFYRNWNDYVNGFGEKDKEFWLGLETIHQLTKDGNYELRVDLTDFDDNTAYAKYGTFSVASRDDNYRLDVGTYSGTAGDALAHNDNNQFSSKDADHDRNSGLHCAAQFRKGGWWYGSCTHSNLNGIYKQGRGTGTTGVFWHFWKNSEEYLKFTEMKFRKKE